MSINVIGFPTGIVLNEEFDAEIIREGKIKEPITVSFAGNESNQGECFMSKNGSWRSIDQKKCGDNSCCSDEIGYNHFALFKVETGMGFTKRGSPVFFTIIMDIILLTVMFAGRQLDTREKI